MNTHLFTRAGLMLALFAAPLAASAQSPAPAMAPMPAMDMSTLDCSTAADHMKSMAMAPSMASSTAMGAADTDKTYVAMMKTMVTNAAMMSKIEMKCGKNAKAMAMAGKMEPVLQDDYLTIEALQNGF